MEPVIKKTIVFVDGQSLFHATKEAFGYPYPNFDIKLLSDKICAAQHWSMRETRFYTGIPDLRDNVFWHTFWSNKLTSMGQIGINIYTRPLRYRNETIALPNGQIYTTLVGQEKGIDIRIALDVIRLAHEKQYDVCLILSQDQDLSEVADEVKRISIEQKRWIKIASAFPDSPTCSNRRGINGSDWIRIDKATYDSCIDPKDYR